MFKQRNLPNQKVLYQLFHNIGCKCVNPLDIPNIAFFPFSTGNLVLVYFPFLKIINFFFWGPFFSKPRVFQPSILCWFQICLVVGKISMGTYSNKKKGDLMYLKFSHFKWAPDFTSWFQCVSPLYHDELCCKNHVKCSMQHVPGIHLKNKI